MSDNKTKLLEDTLRLFNMMGVVEGRGTDGQLMKRIRMELDGSGAASVVNLEVPKGSCPLCGARDMRSCDCDPMEQLIAASK
jgi:hypothetical protein